MEPYLKQYHDEEITDLLNNSDDLLHVCIRVNLTHLQRKQPQLFTNLFQDTTAELTRWNECLLRAQKALIEGNLFLEPGFQIKQNCHVRFVNLPISSADLRKAAYPSINNVGQFLQVKGSVTRMTTSRFLEFKRKYVCTRCKQTVLLEADYTKSYVFDPPGPCPNAREAGCRGQLQPISSQPEPEYCRDYQEIRIQEIMSERNVPASLVVTLEDDLVDCCQPGDCVTICGRIEHRWKPPVVGRRTEITIALRANSVMREESKANWSKDLPEHLLCVQAEWQELVREIGELAARDLLVQSIAPAIRGMYPVKLAIALALASCAERLVDPEDTISGATVRGHSHLLLVGDPGLAKSQLLKFASEIASRAVFTTGMGCSSAGLTAAAVKDEGEWQLEAGALVLADGGVCCIDEFNLMRETDKASIHEAMEQQTISVAKAGMVCKLSTRCVVLAATNPKNLYTMSHGEGMSAANIGIGGPLLSRFDMVLILQDIRAPDWDADIANHLLALAVTDNERKSFDNTTRHVDRVAYWDLEKLQLHFAAIKDIHPRVSRQANIILGAYYKACRLDPFRDPTRTTIRLLDSLFRLAQAHARLLFRSEVTPIDAITVIQLMEASWGFGKIGIVTHDLIKADLPLGPEQNFIDRLLHALNLHNDLQDSIIVRPVDANILRRYHREMIAKQQQKQADQQISQVGCSTITDRDVSSQLAVSSSLPLSNVCVTSTQFTENIRQGGQDTTFQSPSAQSKYGFHAKVNFKKLRNAAITDASKEYNDTSTVTTSTSGLTRKRKHAPSEVEEDLSVKLPLNEAALGNLLGSLRNNFTSGMLSIDRQSNKTQSKDASFSALLDTSKIFDDDDDDFVNELKDDLESARPLRMEPLEVIPIKDPSGTVSNTTQLVPAIEADPPAVEHRSQPFSIDAADSIVPKPSRGEVCLALDDTIPNTLGTINGNDIPDDCSNLSVYQFKRSKPRTCPVEVTSSPTVPASISAPHDVDDLLNFQIEASGEIPLLCDAVPPTANISYVPGVRTQTREKLQQFEFQPKKPEPPRMPIEDDSAYESVIRDESLRHDPRKPTSASAEESVSQYSGLFDGNENRNADFELHLLDIEL